MSYRYSIGRKTIVSVSHASDIAKHMDWIPEHRWEFTGSDILNTINDSVSFCPNVRVSFDGRKIADVYTVMFDYLVEHPYYQRVEIFNKYDWDVNLLTREVTPHERTEPCTYSSFLQDYLDYKGWIQLANLFLNRVKVVSVDCGTKYESECIEWWDCAFNKNGISLTKRYTEIGAGVNECFIDNQYIKSVR